MASPDRHFAAGALFTETAAPGTPNANDVWLYPKSDGRFYGKDDAGTEFPIGTIAGTTGAVDNTILRADGTGGSTSQNSAIVIEDAEIVLNITGDATDDYITAVGNTYQANDGILFLTLTGGSGLSANVTYYVRDVGLFGANTFRVATSAGGGAINFTTNITAGTVLLANQRSVTVSLNTPETNSALVLSPKGNGSFILGPTPRDGNTGIARGNYAVDLQMQRSARGQVASGSSSAICGGTNNTASAAQAFVGAGNTNVASSTDSGVVCGLQNQATTGRSFVGGGYLNLCQVDQGAICGGAQNRVTGSRASILGGLDGFADRYGMQAHASSQFAAQGDAQRARFVLRNATTNNTPTALFLDGSTTRLTIPVNKAMGFTIQVVGSYQGMSENAYFVRKGLIVNDNLTTTIVGSVETIGTDQKSAGATGTDVTVTADDTNEALIITVTGVAAQNWRWVASVDAVEVQYA